MDTAVNALSGILHENILAVDAASKSVRAFERPLRSFD
jgi:hypothetical protein